MESTLAFSTESPTENITFTNTTTQLPLPQFYINSLNFYNYSQPFLLAFGLTGNILSAIIFFRGNMRKSLTALFFRLIAISECIFLFSDMLPTLLEQYTGVETMERTTFLCKIWNYVVFSARDFAAWTLSLVSVERLVGVVFPHKVKTVFTRRRAYMILTFIGLLMLGINSIIIVLVLSKRSKIDNSYVCVINGKLPAKFVDFWTWLDFTTYSAFPFSVILVCNIVIIFTIAKASRARAEVAQGSGAKGTSSMTIILIAVSVTYIILSLPICVYYVTHGELYAKQTLFNIAIFCMYLNHSINFYLYLLTGSKFRLELKMLFCRAAHLKEQPTMTESVSMANTNV